VLVSRDSSPSNWPHRLWTFDQHHQFIGGPAARHRLWPAGGGGRDLRARAIDSSRICINIQNDGDSMYAPGALWTASITRCRCSPSCGTTAPYHQEIMHLQRMANWRQRDVTTAHIGTTIWDPFVQYEKLAEALGQVGIGPSPIRRSWRRRPPRYRGSEDGRTCSHQRRLSAALRGASLMKLPVSLALPRRCLGWALRPPLPRRPRLPAMRPRAKPNFERVGCYQCHGHQGQGGREGPRIADSRAARLACPAGLGAHDQRRHAALYAESPADAELIDIYAYLQSVPKAPGLQIHSAAERDDLDGGELVAASDAALRRQHPRERRKQRLRAAPAGKSQIRFPAVRRFPPRSQRASFIASIRVMDRELVVEKTQTRAAVEARHHQPVGERRVRIGRMIQLQTS